MKVLNYKIKIETDKVISFILTIALICGCYILMVSVRLPKRQVREVVVDQFIDTNLIIKQIENVQKEEITRLPEPDEIKKDMPVKTKTPPLISKVDIRDILKSNHAVRSPVLLSNPVIKDVSSDQRIQKLSLPNLTTTTDAVKKGLDLIINKISSKGKDLPIGVKSGYYENSNIALSEGSDNTNQEPTYKNYDPASELDTPGGKGEHDWPLYQIGYVPEKNDITYELKEIIRWIVANHIDLPGHINHFLQKNKGDATTKVQFRIRNIKYEMFLRATPVIGDEEIAFAICHGNRVGLLIDQGADQKDDMLRVGYLTRNSNGEIIGFKSSFKSFTYKISEIYSKIFWAWWEYQKEKAKK